MKLSLLINKETLKMNFKDVIKKYDNDNNGFNEAEFSNAFNGVTTTPAKGIAKIFNFKSSVFSELDKDKNKVVSTEEMAAYIDKHYKLNFYDFMNMNVHDICELIDKKADELKKMKKRN